MHDQNTCAFITGNTKRSRNVPFERANQHTGFESALATNSTVAELNASMPSFTTLLASKEAMVMLYSSSVGSAAASVSGNTCQ
jgi:hypothetical protein